MDNAKFLTQYDDVLLPKDLQTILHVGRSTVYKLLDTGEIQSIKVGNSYRIPKRNLLRFMFPEE